MAYPSAATSRTDPERIARDPVGRMARDIQELTQQFGCATEADLRRRGWTPASIARHGDAARERVRNAIDLAEEEEEPRRRPTRPRTTPPAGWPASRRSARGRA